MLLENHLYNTIIKLKLLKEKRSCFLSFIFFLLIFEIHESYLNIVSKVFAISPSIVRQEIIDDENDWQPWKIKNEEISNENKNSLSNSTEAKSDKCEKHPLSLPDIQSLSYMSDGNKLNVTLWLTQTFSELLYEDILRNETFSDMSEISFDFSSENSLSSLLSLSSSLQPRIVQFVMAIDIVSVLNKGIDYTVELSSPNESDNPVWNQNIYEISAFGNKKLLYTKSFDTFPYNDKNFVEFSIDLKSIGNPDKYKLLFYIVDIYPVNGEYCRIIDTTNWSLIPPPEFSIIPSTSNIVMRPPEEKNIIVNINTNSDLESKTVLGVNYTSDDNEGEDEREKKVNINFISNKITISPFINNSAILHIIAPEDMQLKDEPKQIPIQIFANISFPQTITNRGGDTYYNNKTISMLEFSDLTLTVLPPLTFNEQLDNFTKSIQPIGQLWGVFTTIGTGISAFFIYLYKRRQKEKE
jgi:hypothetical protein